MGRSQCCAYVHTQGQPRRCKRLAKRGSKFCYQHANAGVASISQTDLKLAAMEPPLPDVHIQPVPIPTVCVRDIGLLRSSHVWTELLDEIKNRLSNHHYCEEMAHKDLYVTETIRYAVVPSKLYSNVNVVFKGGTALAKMSILRRFSADVDVNIVPPTNDEFGSGRRKQVRRELHARLDANIPFKIEHQRYGQNFARSQFRYLPESADIETSAATFGKVLVEMNIRGQPQGMWSYQPITSLAGEAASRLDPSLLEEYPILQPFQVLCVDPLVSVVDKLDALHGRASSDRPQQVSERTRDVYDLAVLLQHGTVQPHLNQDIVCSMHETVIETAPSVNAYRTYQRPTKSFADSPAFRRGHVAYETLRETYPRLQTLVYSNNDWIEFNDAIDIIHDSRNLI